jgi:Holliday junction resolvase RusA-like endonuclease
MTELFLHIPGKLRGKQRARAVARGGFARLYTPQETVNAEAWVRQCCVAQLGSPVLEGPLSVRVSIWCAIPASWSKKKRAAALEGGARPTGKPDIDNSVKLLMDALNTVLWRDDAQVVELAVSKRYAAEDSTILAVRAA